MYKIYIKQVWALIRQERFFSSVYIVGTGLAISMVMALAVAYHIRTANIAPEVHRDRMCYLSNVTYKLNGTKSNYKAACGPRLVKEVIGNLRVPEDVAVTTNSFMMPFSYGDAFMRLPGGDESPKVRLKGCDDGFWRVYRFDFVEGRPFTEAEFLSGMPRAVLCRSLAGRLFGHEAAAGQTILLNGLEYTVSGVVDDVSGITADVYAEAWVTYSSLSVAMDHALGERDGAVGLLEANILLADASDLPALSEELRREVRRYNSGLSEGQVVCEEPLSYADNLLSGLFGPRDLHRAWDGAPPFLVGTGAEPFRDERVENTRACRRAGYPQGVRGDEGYADGAGLRGEYGADAARGRGGAALLLRAGVHLP